MSKTLTYRGKITPGTDPQRIKLTTLNGKTGYMIRKFQILSTTPGVGNVEYVAKIFSGVPDVAATVDFTNSNLLGVAYYQDKADTHYIDNTTVIFDNEIFNQDAYITIVDAAGGTITCNFYIELETVTLSDLQSTQITLKSLKTIASR